jgi:NTE family protein
MKTVGLALSGGAVRGLAHLGVIKVLEEHGIPVHCVAGTSAGSLVGAFLAAGYRSDTLLKIAGELGWGKIAGPAFPSKGLLDGRILERYLEKELGEINIEDLQLPYAAVAVELSSGSLAVFDKGPLAPAVRASCAIPGIFTPLEQDDGLYVDGGIKCFTPVAQARALGADYCIAVKLVPPERPPRKPDNILEVMLASFDLNISHVAELEAAGDVTIVPELEDTTQFDFDKRDTLIERGEEAARRHIYRIQRDLGMRSAVRDAFARLTGR